MPHAKPQPWSPGLNGRHPLAEGLRAAFPFWEGRGATVRDVVAGRLATAYPGSSVTEWVPLDYTASTHIPSTVALRNIGGSSQYVDPGFIFDPAAGPFTLALRVMPYTPASVNRLIAQQADGTGTGRSYFSYLYTTLELSTYLGGSNMSGVPLTANVENTIAVSHDGADLAFNQQGIETARNTRAMEPCDGTLYLGRAKTPASNYFPGHFLAAYIWSRALEAAELALLHADPYAIFARPQSLTVQLAGPAAAAEDLAGQAPPPKHVDFELSSWAEFTDAPTESSAATLEQHADAAYPGRGDTGLRCTLASGTQASTLRHDLGRNYHEHNLRLALELDTLAGGEVVLALGRAANGDETYRITIDPDTAVITATLATGDTLTTDLDDTGLPWNTVELAIDAIAGTAALHRNGISVDTASGTFTALATRYVYIGAAEKAAAAAGIYHLDEIVISAEYVGPVVIAP